jgi:4-amino-4-deoxy-L-arabinose transferase-like glycosyltransferase
MFTKRETIWIPAGLFFLALAARLLFIWWMGADQMIYDSLYDQYTYIDLAKSILAGRGYSMPYNIFVATANQPTAIQPPVYPLALAAIFSIFGESYTMVRVIQALLGAATCVVVYFIAKKLLGAATARVTAILLCVYPLLVMYTRPLMPETLSTLLVASIMLLFVKVTLGTSRMRHFVALGILSGVAFLARPEMLLFALTAACFVVGWTWRQKQHSLRYVLAGVGVAGLAFLVLLSPWVVRNYFAFGEPVVFPSKRWGLLSETWLRYMRETSPNWMPASCKNELECAIPGFERMNELERDRYAANKANEFIRAHPGLYLRYAQSRFFRSYPLIPREELPPPWGYKGVRSRPKDGYHPTSLDDIPLYLSNAEKLRAWQFRMMFLLALTGLAIALKRRHWLVLVAVLPIGFSMAFSLAFSGTERYRLPFDPFLMMLAAYALIAGAAFVRRIAAGRVMKLESVHKAS